MDYQSKTIVALIMLPLQPRRLILLTVLMIAALMIMNKTLPNRMHPKTLSCIMKTKNNLEKMRRTKCLTRYSYDDKKITLKNSKKNLEKIKRTKCLTSFVIKNDKKDCQKDELIMFDLGLGINKYTRMVNGNG